MILPFNFKPALSTYLYMGYPLGILENPTLPDSVLNWNIQLLFQAEKSGPYAHNLVIYPHLNLAGYARLGLLRLHRHIAGPVRIGPAALDDLIRRLLHHQNYAYIYADYFYIPGTGNFNRTHFRHELLVYGYAAEPGHFLGVLYNQEGALGAVTPSAAQLAEAFTSPYARGNECAEYCRGDVLLSIAVNPVTAPASTLDLATIQAQVESYLTGAFVFKFKRNDSDPTTADFSFGNTDSLSRASFGRKVYSEIIHYFDQYLSTGNIRYDLRITRLLWEHKRLMRLRLSRLRDRGLAAAADLLAEWRTIELLAQSIHLQTFAARRRKDTSFFPNIKQGIQQLEIHEAAVLTRLLAVGKNRPRTRAFKKERANRSQPH